jgi:transcriptional regulator with XRE-family HTH domain
MSSETSAALLGAELRRARTAAGLSQDKLAQRLGFDRTTITKAEAGQRIPSPELAEAQGPVLAVGSDAWARFTARLK